MFKLEIKNQLAEKQRRLGERLRNPSSGLLAGARGVATLLRDHFARLDVTKPNRRGWTRTHFWSDVASTVQEPLIAGNSAFIPITHVAIRQKIEGGPILPRHGRYLTIPAANEAYGKRARDFSGLRFGIAWDHDYNSFRAALVRKHGREVTPLFWLVTAVRQYPTPDTLPSDEEIQAANEAGINQWLRAGMPDLGN